MATGHVKWFNRAKGFGFITQGGGEDIFVHYSQIEDAEHENLHQGDTVRFELVQGPKGLHATHVRRLSSQRHTSGERRPRLDHR